MTESTKGYRRNLSLLAICQAMSVSSNALVYTVGSLVGYTLTSNKALATLPIAILVIGQALATIPAAQISRLFGRKGSFTLGTLLGATGGAIGAAGIYFQNFMVFSLALLLMGMFAGFSFTYRFAAAESVPKVLKGKAVSFVLAGGVIGGILGPQLAQWGRSLTHESNFQTAFVILVAVCLFSTMLVQLLQLPKGEKQTSQTSSVRTIGELSKNLTFVVAVMSGTIGFASMTLIMSGTPIAIIGHGHTFSTVAIVIQWHIVAMYFPSFFTGALITRYGELKVIMLVVTQHWMRTYRCYGNYILAFCHRISVMWCRLEFYVCERDDLVNLSAYNG